MKISTNTIQQMNQRYATTNAQLGPIDELVDTIGAQLGAIEETIAIGDKYNGLIVAKVVSCQKHPDADRLNICMIDDGGKVQNIERIDGMVQVVCGAPNVRAGLSVVWLPPGSTVPDSVGSDPFVLGARELRGVISNGMLASPKELAISDKHDGILEIDEDITPGTDFAEAFGLKDDVVLDIENKMFTHRPDCFGFLGVAREIAGIQGQAYKSPDWYSATPHLPKPESDELPLRITNELPDLVPRFSVVTMRDVQIGPSPLWLQIALMKVGARAINNIVDLTNFFMLETGQPLHAYDYDKVVALSNDTAALVVRYPHEDETLALLNGKTITLRSEDIVIATDKQAIGLGGVMGGAETEVDETTKNIIIEAANFDMYTIRRTSMAQGLFTDAVTRFNKGQSPLQITAVLAKIVQDVQRIAHGKVAGELLDDNLLSHEIMERHSLHAPVTVTADFINQRLGLELTAEAMQTLLENVEFKVHRDDQALTVTAPFWRTDIELREDIVEEVGRLYGFDKLPLSLPSRIITPTIKDDLMTFKATVRDYLAKAGANEVLSYSFVPGTLLERAGQNPEQAFKVANALSPELQFYRLSLMPSLLEKVHPNIKAGYDHFALFELGKGHNLQHADDDEGLPTEFEMLDLVVAASDKTKQPGAAYYQAKLYLDTLANDLGITLHYTPLETALEFPIAKPYEYQRSALVSDQATGKPFGIVGEFTQQVRKNFKLPHYSAGFNVSPKYLMKASQQAAVRYTPLPRFPSVSQDITLRVSNDTHEQQIIDVAEAHVPSDTARTLTVIDIFQRAEAPAYKHVTVRLKIASYERTMTDAEVATLLDGVAQAASETLGAERI